jgi:hypothetical protein
MGLVGGGSWLVVHRVRDAQAVELTRQEAETERGVASAVLEAEALQEQARQLVADPPRWGATLTAAASAIRRAEDVLAGGRASEELRQRVQAARAALDADEADHRLLERLDAVAARQGDINPDAMADRRQALLDHKSAFRDYGLDVDGADEAAAARLGARPAEVRRELAAALDYWVFLNYAALHEDYLQQRKRATRADERAAAAGRFQDALAGRRLVWGHRVAVAQAIDPSTPRRRTRQATWEALGGVLAPGDRLRAALQSPDLLSRLRQFPEIIPMLARVDLTDHPPSTLLLIGQLQWTLGDRDGAIDWLRRAQQEYPNDFRLNQRLAVCLADKQPPAWDEVIRFDTAALAVRPRDATVLAHLGHSLAEKGSLEEAVATCRRAVAVQAAEDPKWKAEAERTLRAAERRLELDGRLPALLRGESQPTSAWERIELARLCALKRLFGAAARFYEEAFAAKPEWAEKRSSGDRFQAARAAAQGAAGKGVDVPPPDAAARARWRGQALRWLRAELEALRKELDAGAAGIGPAAGLTLYTWQRDPALAGLRDDPALAELPEPERQTCRKLWADVEALRRRAVADR